MREPSLDTVPRSGPNSSGRIDFGLDVLHRSKPMPGPPRPAMMTLHRPELSSPASCRDRPPIPLRPLAGLLLDGPLARPAHDGTPPDFSSGSHDRRRPGHDRPVPHPRQIQHRRRQMPLDQAVHRQARRRLSGLQRRERGSGESGRFPRPGEGDSTSGRRRWATRHLPSSPKRSTSRSNSRAFRRSRVWKSKSLQPAGAGVESAHLPNRAQRRRR